MVGVEYVPEAIADEMCIRDRCWLQPDPSNDIRTETRRFCIENGYTFHNAREHRGLMRNMICLLYTSDQTLLLRAVQDGFVERGGQQFGDDCQDVDAHVSELKN